MRRVLLVAALVAFGMAGAAYAATVVTNKYVVSGKVTPKKSGTTAHPKPIGVTIKYTVGTTPKGERPNVVKKLVATLAGVRAHTNDFPTCSTSTLSSKGPSACPKGSLVGTGFFIAEIGAASSHSGMQLTCRVDLSVFNGGGNSLSYYAFLNPAHSNECPNTPNSGIPVAFPTHLKEVGTTLVQTINVPFVLRHPGNNTALDAAPIQSQITTPVKTRKLKGKTVGFAESIACPANHKRHISIRFTLENGKSQTTTANVPCK
jgi:hypothetical protein